MSEETEQIEYQEEPKKRPSLIEFLGIKRGANPLPSVKSAMDFEPKRRFNPPKPMLASIKSPQELKARHTRTTINTKIKRYIMPRTQINYKRLKNIRRKI